MDENKTESGLTPEQVAEEAKAEEEFLSAPEDTVNPLVPEEEKASGAPDGMISSADVSEAAPVDENLDLVSNEENVLSGVTTEPIVEETENPADNVVVEQSVN